MIRCACIQEAAEAALAAALGEVDYAEAASPSDKETPSPERTALRAAFLGVPWWAAVTWSASLAAAAVGLWLLFDRRPLIP